MKLNQIRSQMLFAIIAVVMLAVAVFAQNPDGDPIQPGYEINDQRAGSMLIYNYYRKTVWAFTENTYITVTNTNGDTSVRVKFTFVESATGYTRNYTVNVDPYTTANFDLNTYLPGLLSGTGYAIAIAVNENDEPIPFDYLTGAAKINFSSTLYTSLKAVAVPISPTGYYAALPRQLAMDQMPSPLSTQKRMLVINRIDGSLLSQISGIGNLQGDLFAPSANSRSFDRGTFGPQARILVEDLFTSPVPWSIVFPSSQFSWGWLRIRATEQYAISGAVLYLDKVNGVNVNTPISFNMRHLTGMPATLETSGGTMYFGY